MNLRLLREIASVPAWQAWAILVIVIAFDAAIILKLVGVL